MKENLCGSELGLCMGVKNTINVQISIILGVAS